MSLQTIIFFIVCALIAENHCLFQNLLARPPQDDKLFPLGRFRLNLANSDLLNLGILPVPGRGSQIVNLFFRPVTPPPITAQDRIRAFLRNLNPFNRQPQQMSTNGFDSPLRPVVVANLGSNQWTPLVPVRLNQNTALNVPFDSGMRPNWTPNVLNAPSSSNAQSGLTEQGDLKILGPNFKILLNHRNQQMLQEDRNTKEDRPNSNTPASDLISRFRPSTSFGMASEYVNPGYGDQYKNIANYYKNYDNQNSNKNEMVNNSNSEMQEENFSDYNPPLRPPVPQSDSPEPLDYMVPPPTQPNNMYWESGITNNGPTYATKYTQNPVRNVWSNQYDNPYNQPYPNYLQYAGWNHRVDSTKPRQGKYTTVPYSVYIPSSNNDKLMEKSDNEIDIEQPADTKVVPSEENVVINEDDLSSLNVVEKNSNDLTDNLETIDIDDEIPLF